MKRCPLLLLSGRVRSAQRNISLLAGLYALKHFCFKRDLEILQLAKSVRNRDRLARGIQESERSKVSTMAVKRLDNRKN